MKRLHISFFLSLLALTTSANVKLPRIFSDNMVLQRDHVITVWGWADGKEKITVQFNTQSKTVTAGKDGKWKIQLASEAAGGPYVLTVKGKNTLVLNNVLVGDVWICSGQSNMEWTVRNSNNSTTEIAQANFPQIRHFKVPNTVAVSPRDDVAGGDWKVCSPDNVSDFTAVGYFFARELYKELNIPIGLINTSWGGTHSETWTSRSAFESSDEFRSMITGMPHLNLDSLANVKASAAKARIVKMQGAIDEPVNVVQTWKSPTFDDQAWPTMTLPAVWEGQSLGDVDGLVWLRKTITLNANQAGKDATLSLAMIDDSDETFVNGVPVGSTKNQYSAKRVYNVPAGVLQEGKNVIAIRVEDTGGGGGVFGDAQDLSLAFASTKLPLAGAWTYRVEGVQKNAGVGPNSYPTLLFNAMINPLLPMTIKGAIWYQGESNAGRAYQYRKAFPLMINDWRKHWGLGDFPFYFVQLASYNADNGNSKNGSNWAELREAQTLTLSLPRTGMAVTTDIGDPHDIHPRNKQDVGKRLAAVALHDTYGKNVVYSGPVFQSLKVEGQKAILSFTQTGSGLLVKDRYGYAKGFEVAGADGVFHYAKAFVEGDHVVVYQDDVKTPVAVRYGWADDASDDNLFNKEGFPAPPFRTDNVKGITEQAKFDYEH
ncbi:sialate O-acetylesterase [Chryseolinea lacunae]|uniref:Beta galactosidase jelly roll domain-containing protein n=1 Tax=Chryseolinea lacunae TaxID=2801331 RepID=A0ABS1KL36_9BACT|nr:sialate O-acetylesterase [Chryseolinea lacunae]MBL0740060.1 beta galactosidase jelly roll domain-containing protein [Chryseolinea lacunae]